jgi:hypothetical protein
MFPFCQHKSGIIERTFLDSECVRTLLDLMSRPTYPLEFFSARQQDIETRRFEIKVGVAKKFVHVAQNAVCG